MTQQDEFTQRTELVGDAATFLREVDAGRRPDADPEVVDLCRSILETNARERKAVAEALAEWSRLRSEGDTQEELEAAVAPYMERLHEAHDSMDKAAEKLAEIAGRG